ncbi:unnamed protein product [Echinostoma caproni]|uniref:Uncharacterized protein n=1 Tax=Echinostoma caproni TaxID=27848 RepID=A0A183BFC2_9TREM|nr:unnamed protein product [Echinostoma caproni]
MRIGGHGLTTSQRLGNTVLRQSTEERDLGIVGTSNLKTRAQTDNACVSAWSMLDAIHGSLGPLPLRAVKLLFTSNVRFQLEYGGPAVFHCMASDVA